MLGKILVRITKNHKISVLISLNTVCFFGREDSQGGGLNNSMIEDIDDREALGIFHDTASTAFMTFARIVL